jgi:hypothetical protein
MNEGGEIGDTITSHRKLLILCRNHAGKFSIFRRLHFALTFGIFDFKLSCQTKVEMSPFFQSRNVTV